MNVLRSLLALSTLTLLWCITQYLTRTPSSFTCTILDVGQGDSILCLTPSGKKIMIDGGPDASVVNQLSKELPWTDHTIDLLVITHPDSDHTGGLTSLLSTYSVRFALLTGVSHSTKTYTEVLKLLTEKHIPLLQPNPQYDLVFDTVVIDQIWPSMNDVYALGDDTNDGGIVLRLSENNHSILLTADIEKFAEEQILRRGEDLSSEVLKIAHHGSHTSSSTGFVLAVHPSLAVISAGKHNSYGHPHKSTLQHLKSWNIPYRLTATEGSIHLWR